MAALLSPWSDRRYRSGAVSGGGQRSLPVTADRYQQPPVGARRLAVIL
jgi:hypothetical protein